MAIVYPALVSELQAALAQPVLYFDHDHQLVFDGDAVGGGITYRGVQQWEAASPQLAVLGAAIARGDQLTLTDRELVVERDAQTFLRLTRTDPALGFLAPFDDTRVAPA
jgi:hypothetical protein